MHKVVFRPKDMIMVIIIIIIIINNKGLITSGGNSITYIRTLLMAFVTLIFNLGTKRAAGNASQSISQKIVILFLIPILFLMVFSIVFQLIDKQPMDYMKRSITTGIYLIIAWLFAYEAIRFYKKRAVSIFFIAAVISYSLTIIKGIMQYGVSILFHTININTKMAYAPLEVDVLTYIFALFVIYYLIIDKNYKKGVLAFVFCFLGYKRIILFALITILIIHWVYLKRVKNLRKMVPIISIFCIVVANVYIYIIKYNILDLLAIKYNIEFNFRLKFYSIFSQDYSLSPFNIGKGLGFSDMRMKEVLINSWGLNSATTMHGDILKTFIALGIVLFVIYLVLILWVNTNKINTFYGKKASFGYFLMTLFLFICMFASNAWYDQSISLIYALLCFALPYNNSEESIKAL